MRAGEALQSFPVDRGRLAPYIYWSWFWMLLFIGVGTFGVALPLWLCWILGAGSWYARRFVELYTAGLQDKRVRIHHGVVFQKRKAIPLDRVTDVLISQGFLERRMGVCQVRIQTAGTGNQGTAEGVILAVPQAQADEVQDGIIAARDRYAERST
jgi:uncharacterized membrane protein YdbT with pleckstrin-like domain